MLARGGRAKRDDAGSTCTHMISARPKCILIPDAGDGITLCRCVYEHARATAREARVSRREGIDPCTPHAFARPPLLLLSQGTHLRNCPRRQHPTDAGPTDAFLLYGAAQKRWTEGSSTLYAYVSS